MGNYVIAVRKYVIVTHSQVGNYMIADSRSRAEWRGRGGVIRPWSGERDISCRRAGCG
jgi:hypothetical protein